MDYGKEFLPLREACKLVGLGTQTVRDYGKKNFIKTFTTPTGRILYNNKSLLDFIKSDRITEKKEKIIYCRVSSQKQINDLEIQKTMLRSLFPDHAIVSDVASGINWKRKGLCSILESAMSGTLEEVVVAHRDRIARFGFELIKWIIESGGGKIIVLDEDKEKSSEQELAEDILSIITIFSCRQM